MSKSDEYSRYADECRRMADNAGSPSDKSSWLRLADCWLRRRKTEAVASEPHDEASGRALWRDVAPEDKQSPH